MALDRKAALLAQTVLTGIDFVAVDTTQTVLDVFFLQAPEILVPAVTFTAAQVTITGDDADPSVPIANVDWATVDARQVLRVTTARPGGWGRYVLALAHPQIDPFFARLEIDFKAACPSKLDCAPAPHECPPEGEDDVVVDGLARDFWSLRRALLDFAARRNPRWADRLEADVGVMLVEALAAVGDELAYYQDRVAREAQFGAASQRRSLRRHARLVDYEPHDGRGATGFLAVEVADGFVGFQQIPAGTDVWARSDGARPVGFEIGTGLGEVIDGVTYGVNAERNELVAHRWDDDEGDAHAAHRPFSTTCLPAGSTAMHVDGHHAAHLSPGERVVIVTEPPLAVATDDVVDPLEPNAVELLPRRRMLVTLVDVVDEIDPLATQMSPEGVAEITRLVWAEPTAVELDLRYARVLGNVVPISAGVTRDEVFSIGESDQPVPRAVERSGPNGTTAYLFTLPDKAGEGLVRLGPDPHTALPEIDLVEAMPPAWTTGLVWTWRRALLGTNSSTAHDRHFTLDDGTWDRAVTYRRIGETIVHRDYLAGIGTTVRFGDGVFGQRPAEGNAGVDAGEFFRVRYRLGNGVRANVPAEAVRHADPNGTLGFGEVGLPFVERVWNPLPTSGGLEPASADEIRRDAPYAFQTVTHRAVRPEDYNDVAARLPWVQRAGTRFRWTGSWLTAFTAADARGLSILPASSRRELAAHLDRFRQTGREVHVLAPRYVDLDLRIAICVEPASYVADVVLAVMRALVGKRGVRPVPGFFDPDRFTFGTALDRSELEAAVQRVPGVRAVKAIYIARRGWFAEQPMVDPYYQPGIDEVIRVDNDPRHPDRGTIKIDAEGGA